MAAATADAFAAVPSIPLLNADGGRSSQTESICARTRSVETGSHLLTPRVFWAVTAVIAEVPKTPNRWNVLRSAWIPAPPPESEPAMVSAMRIKRKMRRDVSRRALSQARRNQLLHLPRWRRWWQGLKPRLERV